RSLYSLSKSCSRHRHAAYDIRISPTLPLSTSLFLVSLLSATSLAADYTSQDANCTRAIFQGGIPDQNTAEKASRTVCAAIDCIGGSAAQQLDYTVDYFLFRCYSCPFNLADDVFSGCTLDQV
ncbi:hypothetical protein BUE80_DR005113, partial [Diplocarpon rosae]